MQLRVCLFLAALASVCACAPSGGLGGYGPGATRMAPAGGQARQGLQFARSPIRHVVIIVQENRSVDNLFQFLPGADTQSYGYDSHGKKIPLQSQPLNSPYDIPHTHAAWKKEYNSGAMNGFDHERCAGRCPADPAYAYVPQNNVAPYYTLAESYAFADRFFEPDQGPSFVAHQYLVSGTSTVSDGSPYKADDNPSTPLGRETGGCDSPPGSLVNVIDPSGHQPPSLRTFPCFDRQSLMNEMDAAGVSWTYYQASHGAGIWNAVDAIRSIWSKSGEMAAHVVTPPSHVLYDIANGKLADVVWVTPTKAASDHPKANNGTGPSWVGSVVDAVGNSEYWNSTAIFIVWDDWGGWYDHVAPPIYNSFELGFRVPMIVVSPYAKAGYVSHAQHEFGSILKFTEETFGLPSLGTTDKRADDLSDCFNFAQRPRRFEAVHTTYPASYFLHRASTDGPDND